jgi:4-hydroxythreonine-4-phosphate dehydrogenase
LAINELKNELNLPHKVSKSTTIYMNRRNKPVVAITVGDINGVGPEIILRTLSDNRLTSFFTPVVYGSSKTLSYYRKNFHLDHFNAVQMHGEVQHGKINVVNCWDDIVEIKPGQSTKEAGKCARKSLVAATDAFKEGIVSGVVTAPINKDNTQSDDFNFPGHTEYFQSSFDSSDSLMFMVSDNLRIGVVTGHIPLSKVSGQITKERVSSKLSLVLRSLKSDFGISKPKVAVLGLNPHAGENGLLGTEEQEVIAPTVSEYKENGDLVYGPFSADGFFGSGQHKKFDAILAMYHDQGLVPFKSLSFGSGVNFTAGLPIVRTSPDHGTGYDIAGQGIASESSMRAALLLCADIVRMRKGEFVVNS